MRDSFYLRENGQRVDKLFPLISHVHEQARKRLSTGYAE
jgi:hypothetical protein